MLVFLHDATRRRRDDAARTPRIAAMPPLPRGVELESHVGLRGFLATWVACFHALLYSDVAGAGARPLPRSPPPRSSTRTSRARVVRPSRCACEARVVVCHRVLNIRQISLLREGHATVDGYLFFGRSTSRTLRLFVLRTIEAPSLDKFLARARANPWKCLEARRLLEAPWPRRTTRRQFLT